jgi:hypothetical protein
MRYLAMVFFLTAAAALVIGCGPTPRGSGGSSTGSTSGSTSEDVTAGNDTGGDDTGSSLTCGPGTHEENGMCVPDKKEPDAGGSDTGSQKMSVGLGCHCEETLDCATGLCGKLGLCTDDQSDSAIVGECEKSSDCGCGRCLSILKECRPVCLNQDDCPPGLVCFTLAGKGFDDTEGVFHKTICTPGNSSQPPTPSTEDAKYQECLDEGSFLDECAENNYMFMYCFGLCQQYKIHCWNDPASLPPCSAGGWGVACAQLSLNAKSNADCNEKMCFAWNAYDQPLCQLVESIKAAK